ncbi:MAG: hypothetical protein M1594_01195 [Candidatus Marsarchaeota archaeon]|nr:hypothetical protein [Candidatus Marsarchaeota archaeon]
MPIDDYLKQKGKQKGGFNDKLARFWNKYGDAIANIPFIPGTGILDWFVTRKVLGHPSREDTDKILKAHKSILIKNLNDSLKKGLPELKYKTAITNVNKAIEINRNAPEGRLMQIRPFESKFKMPSVHSLNRFDERKTKQAFRALSRLEHERKKFQPKVGKPVQRVNLIKKAA